MENVSIILLTPFDPGVNDAVSKWTLVKVFLSFIFKDFFFCQFILEDNK